jgi:hypothetical protein
LKLRKDAIDISGKKFGELTAMRPVPKNKGRGVKWLCKCECGNETIANGGHLRAGKRVSCGCRSQARIFETGINRIYANYKRKAKLRGLSFTISREEFGNLVVKNCHYCNREPSNVLKRLKTKKLQIEYNGIDRFDPSIGYEPGNLVSCCYYCNHAKLDLTYEQFRTHIARIIKWQQKDF